ncbi:uncharacterized protein LOC133440508 [Cololabis saira]|uniref:uncharacterized protein LOC133440508 n=1 Tax=Cololabis saira TaxID=129043 RepID=UPI002AD33C88|nr:uncharacterized protein LOC133440508 [Cololabis saira]XP_061573763.1 uncharacterized protein LOC133440508 [Cololabis saira]XP_061573764.1 uncharacterized protein LOC133440508 [Cololabis saira]
MLQGGTDMIRWAVPLTLLLLSFSLPLFSITIFIYYKYLIAIIFVHRTCSFLCRPPFFLFCACLQAGASGAAFWPVFPAPPPPPIPGHPVAASTCLRGCLLLLLLPSCTRPRVPTLCFLSGRHVSRVKEILEVFLPPSDNVPSRGQQLPTRTVNGAGRVLLPPSEAPNGPPEFPRGRPKVFLHGLPELLPDPSFCLQDCPSRGSLGLPVPIYCVRSPTGQHSPVGLLLQSDGILYFRCPPPGSRIAATTGTGDLASAASSRRVDNGGREHGPLGLNVPRLPRDPREALPEVGVEDVPDRGLIQTFPTDPHNPFGSARSVQPLPPPAHPTHHQVVIS